MGERPRLPLWTSPLLLKEKARLMSYSSRKERDTACAREILFHATSHLFPVTTFSAFMSRPKFTRIHRTLKSRCKNQTMGDMRETARAPVVTKPKMEQDNINRVTARGEVDAQSHVKQTASNRERTRALEEEGNEQEERVGRPRKIKRGRPNAEKTDVEERKHLVLPSTCVPYSSIRKRKRAPEEESAEREGKDGETRAISRRRSAAEGQVAEELESVLDHREVEGDQENQPARKMSGVVGPANQSGVVSVKDEEEVSKVSPRYAPAASQPAFEGEAARSAVSGLISSNLEDTEVRMGSHGRISAVHDSLHDTDSCDAVEDVEESHTQSHIDEHTTPSAPPQLDVSLIQSHFDDYTARSAPSQLENSHIKSHFDEHTTFYAPLQFAHLNEAQNDDTHMAVDDQDDVTQMAVDSFSDLDDHITYDSCYIEEPFVEQTSPFFSPYLAAPHSSNAQLDDTQMAVDEILDLDHLISYDFLEDKAASDIESHSEDEAMDDEGVDTPAAEDEGKGSDLESDSDSETSDDGAMDTSEAEDGEEDSECESTSEEEVSEDENEAEVKDKGKGKGREAVTERNDNNDDEIEAKGQQDDDDDDDDIPTLISPAFRAQLERQPERDAHTRGILIDHRNLMQAGTGLLFYG
ncbi:hypothetical protein P389DRAFT_103515 [Cystobasidium minutum MCA 4210]|uniref:uncharacterized protein n=1 Tax=Cystobasidium minutum MCA 4210 TaxID=1397322 RepID=UPI0034D008C7|eukprot:jgi/Rhomi1/103515/CE103514_164